MICSIRSAILVLVIAVVFQPSCTSEPVAAAAQHRLLKMHYENSAGERGVTTFAYDAEGRQVAALWNLLDGSRFSLNRHEYNEAGQFVSKHRTFSDGLTSVDTYQYDDQNRLILERFERSDSVGGVAVYQFDAEGRPYRAIYEQFKGWLTAEVVYACDSLGRKVTGGIVRDTSIIGSIAYDYNVQGDLAREHWDFGGRFTQTFTYEYDLCVDGRQVQYLSSNVFIRPKAGYRLSGETYDYSGEAGGPSYFEYDSTGQLVNKKFVRSDGLTTETLFFCDCSGELLYSHRSYADGRTAFFDYDFNEHGLLTERHMYASDSTTSSEQYEYDAESRLVKGTWDKFDSWLTGTFTFTHNAEGGLESGRFVSAAEWTADIDFGHDEIGNLNRVHWNFSFGKSQTYTFEYESVTN